MKIFLFLVTRHSSPIHLSDLGLAMCSKFSPSRIRYHRCETETRAKQNPAARNEYKQYPEAKRRDVFGSTRDDIYLCREAPAK